MSAYRPYPNYKPSGVECLGDVPDGWMLTKLKFSSFIEMGQSPNSEDYNLESLGYPFLQGNAEFGTRSPKAKHWCATVKKLAECGDFLFSVRAPIGAVNEADQIYGIGRGLCAIRPSRKVLDRRFIFNSFALIREQMSAVSTGSTFEGVSAEQLGSSRHCLPPLDEQHQIASFLDRECGKLDDLQAKQERLIELLKEKRQALISHAVTKGLDPNAKLKPSGIEWLGDVPEHWEVKPLKYVASFNDDVLPEGFGEDEEIEYVDIGSVSLEAGIERTETFRFCEAPSRARRRVRDGDVIVSTVRTYLKAIAPVVEPPANLIVSTGFAVVRSLTTLESNFAKFSLQSGYFVDEVISRSTGVSYPAINSSELATIPLVIPPLPEQIHIATFLDRECSKLDTLHRKAECAIALLKERRSALISAAVTGKIDVREHSN